VVAEVEPTVAAILQEVLEVLAVVLTAVITVEQQLRQL
jgi:hypothetical protein